MTCNPEKHMRDGNLSEAALNRRLRRLGDLYDLGLSLRRAKQAQGKGMVRESRRQWEESTGRE